MPNEEINNKERDELHRAIWAIAEDLRGSVDGWDFKNYVLGTMFYRYISENLTNYINKGEIAAGNTNFDYAKMADKDAETARSGLVEEKGFFILPSELFCNVHKAANDDTATFIDKDGHPASVKDNLNELLEMIFIHIENSAVGTESEGAFEGLFDDFDVNSNKLGSTVIKRNETLRKLLDGIANMNLGDVKNNTIDAFGDAYEYLMTMYASNAGKSGGEFFTPSDVSKLLTRLGTVGKKYVNKVYDPACGSGSLLLKAEEILGKDGVRNGFYGQEINITTYNLCRINMFLHDVEFDKFDIACEDTLVSPQHLDDGPFDLIVSNPPYSIKWEGDDSTILQGDERYSVAGVLAPKGKADMAFIMHSLYSLAPNGTAAIVCFPGLMHRGKAEQKIRKYLVDNNRVDAIIQLPENLFFGTPISTCIMVLKKNKEDNSVLFIDASKEFVKTSTNNRLSEENSNKIIDAYIKRENIEHFCALVSHDDIEKKKYNLSVSTYVEKADTKEAIDIDDLNSRLADVVAKENQLRAEIDAIIKEL
ncbi:type I restriction-modification system subunit M [Butyrivibrio sp. AE2032]|uniref:type I restriction-modification system subunit M n=1 Tax=Butyrivibrio sp. AE2032 TaxID=1458463 RepID=UPI00054F3807|nr:type I restriction-modification system subunit M [Butyrivibrio sp. AE2032]